MLSRKAYKYTQHAEQKKGFCQQAFKVVYDKRNEPCLRSLAWRRFYGVVGLFMSYMDLHI